MAEPATHDRVGNAIADLPVRLLMSVDDVARALSVSPATVYRMTRDGTLTPIRLGRALVMLSHPEVVHVSIHRTPPP